MIFSDNPGHNILGLTLTPPPPKAMLKIGSFSPSFCLCNIALGEGGPFWRDILICPTIFVQDCLKIKIVKDRLKGQNKLHSNCLPS